MPKNVRLCPKCRSHRVRYLTNVAGWLGPRKFICDECGHMGPFFIEVDLDELKRQREEKTNKQP